jgi:hypothetical protein
MGVSLGFLMTGQDRRDQRLEMRLPTALAVVAAEEGLPFRQALTWLHTPDQIATHRKSTKKNGLTGVD